MRKLQRVVSILVVLGSAARSAVLPVALGAQEDERPPSSVCGPALVGEGYLCGLVDGDRLVRAPDLLEVLPFSSDGRGGWVAAARAASGWGYLDGEGRWRVEPTLSWARAHGDDGLARFRRGDVYGYVDATGREVVPATYREAQPFRFGLAAVLGPKGWSYLDTRGAVAIPGPFEAAGSFSAIGLAPVRHEGAAKLGYVDRAGEIVIAARFDDAGPFSANGLAAAAIEKPVRGSGWSLDVKLYGLIDAGGRWRLEPKYSQIGGFDEAGLASFVDQPPGGYAENGFLDADGRVVARGSELARQVRCGLIRQGSRGRFLGLDGRAVIERKLDWAGPFDEGCVARTLDGGKVRLLHPDGRLVEVPGDVREPLLDRAASLVAFEGSAGVHLLTDDGAVIVDGDGSELHRFRIGSDGAVTLVDAAGSVLWRASGEEARAFSAAARLLRDEREDALDRTTWASEPGPLVGRLAAEKPRDFFPCSFAVYEDCEDAYDVDALREEYEDETVVELVHRGAFVTLARRYVDTSLWGSFERADVLASRAFDAYFDRWAGRLTAELGRELPEGELRPLRPGDGNRQRAWKLGDRFVVLEWLSESGDGDLELQLLLGVVDARSRAR